jgi:hypothetical protein
MSDLQKVHLYYNRNIHKGIPRDITDIPYQLASLLVNVCVVNRP